MAILNPIKEATCLYCKKVFFISYRMITKGRKISCGWCGREHVNKSNTKVHLVKAGENGKNEVSSSNAKKSSTRKKSKAAAS